MNRGKKRRWDQPAESLISAGLLVPGLVPLAMNGAAGVTVPGANAPNAGLLLNTIPTACATVPQLLPTPVKPKIQDELIIAREVVINDADPAVRYKLTKRQTQEEIQRSTGAVVITRGRYRPPDELSGNEKPLYLHISAGAHLKDTAERVMAVDRAASMVEGILNQGQNVQSGHSFHLASGSGGQATQLLSTCVPLGFDPDPSLNITARIRGPNDQYISHIMNVTGATVVLRGRGSGNPESSAEETNEPIHLYLSSNTTRSLEEARILAENLLDTICSECGASRTPSSKVYGAVPPPQQLLVSGVQSSAQDLSVNTLTSSVCPTTISSSVVPYSAQSTNATIYTYPQPSPSSYPYPSVTKGTSYAGYGGIYPQATPLQQVALALRQAPASTSSVPATSTSAPTTVPATNSSAKSNPSSTVETERQRQRRKFQELTVAAGGSSAVHQKSCQEAEFLKPGALIGNTSVKIVSSVPPAKLIQSDSDKMFRRALTVPPRAMPPPPPPKFDASQSLPKSKEENPVTKKQSNENVPDTLLQLMEYGDDEEDDAVDGRADQEFSWSVKSAATAKPFWAV